MSGLVLGSNGDIPIRKLQYQVQMSQPNINTPNSDLVSSLSQSQSYLSPNFLVILPGLTSSVRLCGVERCPAQQSEEEEEEIQCTQEGDTTRLSVRNQGNSQLIYSKFPKTKPDVFQEVKAKVRMVSISEKLRHEQAVRRMLIVASIWLIYSVRTTAYKWATVVRLW